MSSWISFEKYRENNIDRLRFNATKSWQDLAQRLSNQTYLANALQAGTYAMAALPYDYSQPFVAMICSASDENGVVGVRDVYSGTFRQEHIQNLIPIPDTLGGTLLHMSVLAKKSTRIKDAWDQAIHDLQELATIFHQHICYHRGVLNEA